MLVDGRRVSILCGPDCPYDSECSAMHWSTELPRVETSAEYVGEGGCMGRVILVLG